MSTEIFTELARKIREDQVNNYFERVFQKEEVLKEQDERRNVWPKGWGTFASGMSDEKMDQDLLNTGFMTVSPNKIHPYRETSTFWTRPALRDTVPSIGSIYGNEIVITAPQDYFLTPPGDHVMLRGHIQFTEGSFTLVARENVEIIDIDNHYARTF